MKKKLSKETIRKMREVIAAVLREPKFYDQSHFPQAEDCGSTCCAAGWVVWLHDPNLWKKLMLDPFMQDWDQKADQILGIKSGGKLFIFAHQWPKQFWLKYSSAGTHIGRAQAMADRWEHYIATDGAE